MKTKGFSKIVERYSEEEEEKQEMMNKEERMLFRKSIRKSIKLIKFEHSASSRSSSDEYDIKFNHILNKVDPNTL